MMQYVKSGISGLASALKVGAEHVYVVLVRQQVVKAISDIIVVLLMTLLSYVLFNLCRKTYKAHLVQCGWKEDGTGKKNYDIDLDDSPKGITSVILGICSGVALIIAVVMFCTSYTEMITGFVNPEYGAMKDIIEFVKPHVATP